ncbi:unnamed protein product [Prorocentrum cordatum]|uniref:Uncharacterized protein n=1 Tax=Prorocentrum cordatum TaxID=2364126 RepID=A0ABN9SC63_9DINO|nr:unnamed protein product [Polarella glacialis]
MIARLAGLTPELPASGRVPPQAWDRWKWRSRNASWESLSDRARWSAERPAYFSQALMAAHTEASRAAIRGYIGLRKMKIPLSLALLSNVLAIAALRSGPELFQVWEVISPCVQNILLRAYLTSFLGFFTGFSLNNAFQRFSRGLDHVQQLSVHLRTGTDLVLSLLAGSGEPGTPNIDRNAEEVVSWTKVYFIQACRGLHSVTLRTKRSKLDRAMEQWETFLSEQVVLSAACVSAVAAHSDVFVSTLQMELLWWRWLAPVLGSCPVDVQPSRKSFDAARSSFHAAHLLASGMTFPITMRLLESRGGHGDHVPLLSLPPVADRPGFRGVELPAHAVRHVAVLLRPPDEHRSVGALRREIRASWTSSSSGAPRPSASSWTTC